MYAFLRSALIFSLRRHVEEDAVPRRFPGIASVRQESLSTQLR